jgi:5-methyltetrahydrofolate--homocysteine methyltransferase
MTSGDRGGYRSPYLDVLRERVLVFDGGMGTSIQRYELTAEDFGGKEGCYEYLVLSRPGIVEEIHASFIDAGCDVLETDTFGASRLRLDGYGLREKVYEINFQAGRLARRVADRSSTPDRPRFVAGSMGPAGRLPAEGRALDHTSFDKLADEFCEQARALIEGGVDLLTVETMFDLLELRAAVVGIHRAFGVSGRWVPIQAQVTLDDSGRMLSGEDIGEVTDALCALDVDVVGLNCGSGPEGMLEPARYLGEHCPKPVSVIPSAGLPVRAGGKMVYRVDPEVLAGELLTLVEECGVDVVGGCCGTTPEHLKAVVERIGR